MSDSKTTKVDNPRAEMGMRGELEALELLAREGLQLVERNFRVREGEIDLVFREAETLVFVEVRSSGMRYLKSPGESILAPKRRKVVRAAEAYLRMRNLHHVDVRFDVVEVQFRGERAYRRWTRDAFRPEPTAQDLRFR